MTKGPSSAGAARRIASPSPSGRGWSTHTISGPRASAKCAAKAPRPRPVTSTTRSIPHASSSSTMCCTTGRPATGSSPLGTPRESGRSRVASPATGTTAVVMATGDGRLVHASARVFRAASFGAARAYSITEGKGSSGGRVAFAFARGCPAQRLSCDLAAGQFGPHTTAAPGAEFLRTSRVFHSTFRRAGGRTSVFPRLEGVGPTFDARVSKAVAKHARSHPTRRTRLRTTTRAPNRHTLLSPSVMLFAPTTRASGGRAAAVDAPRAPRRSAPRPARACASPRAPGRRRRGG